MLFGMDPIVASREGCVRLGWGLGGDGDAECLPAGWIGQGTRLGEAEVVVGVMVVVSD